MRLLLVVGTRPNFIKAAPLIRELNTHKDIEYNLIHTGQHYDSNMSEEFFTEFNLPKPHINLNIGSGTHTEQTARIMINFETVCVTYKPDVVIVFGDVNSTLAAALVVTKLPNVKLAHIEAGERSFDRTMPEEINRILTDQMSDWLFCTSRKARNNLLNEGIHSDKICIVGNLMVDNLLYYNSILGAFSLDNEDSEYVLLTLHRAGNADNKTNLENVLKAVSSIDKVKVIFPCHPRTKKQIDKFGLNKYLDNIIVKEPLGYHDFISYMKGASVVLTDSGGIQVETSILDIPCLTLRENTEWEWTIDIGTNILIGTNPEKIKSMVDSILQNNRKAKFSTSNYKPASPKIINILKNEFINASS